LRIGVFGLWGMNVPGVSFGGFETAYSEVGSRLAQRGHDVAIYCRRARYPSTARLPMYRGVRLKYVPSLDTKSLSAISATWMALADSRLAEHFDVHLFANIGMGLHCLALKTLGERVVMNVDGLDWERAKWNALGKLYFRLAACAAIRHCDVLIADSLAMQRHYTTHFGVEPTYITYGAHIIMSNDPARLTRFGLKPRDYLLIVSRFVPENNLHIMLDAYERLSADVKLVVVGGTNHPTEYEAQLHQHQSNRIIFTGYMSDRATLNELFCNCYAYLHGHSVGGTNPALLDALGCGCCILAVDTPFNAEVLANGRFGLLFDAEVPAAAQAMERILADPRRASRLRALAPHRIRDAYNWDDIVHQYEILLKTVVSEPRAQSIQPMYQ
jgi:glycosyltransferase involved in cell wall biosynthesis